MVPFQRGLTLQRHIMEVQKDYPSASGDFSILLSQISLAAKIIGSEVRQAGLEDNLGFTGDENIQNDHVQKLDVLANQTMIRMMRKCGKLCVIVSEEDDDPIDIPEQKIWLRNSPKVLNKRMLSISRIFTRRGKPRFPGFPGKDSRSGFRPPGIHP